MKTWKNWSVSYSVVSDSLWPHGLQLTRLLCLWNSPGKNIGVGSHSLLQEIFLTQVWTWVSHMASRFFTVWAAKGCYCRFLSIWYFLENFKYNSVSKKKNYYYVHEYIYWIVCDKCWRSMQVKNPSLNFGTSFILCPSFLLQRCSNNITSGIRDSYFLLCWLLSHSLGEKLHVIWMCVDFSRLCVWMKRPHEHGDLSLLRVS